MAWGALKVGEIISTLKRDYTVKLKFKKINKNTMRISVKK
jgi:hypothetical protein